MTEPSIPSTRGAVDLGALASSGPQQTAPAAQEAGASWTLRLDEANFQEFIALSQRVPAIVSLGTTQAQVSVQLDELLTRLVDARGGQFVLGLGDVHAHPQLAQAFGAEQIPLVIAVVSGRPVPLLQGPATEEQVSQVLDQLAALAIQQGLSGTVPPFSGVTRMPKRTESNFARFDEASDGRIR